MTDLPNADINRGLALREGWLTAVFSHPASDITLWFHPDFPDDPLESRPPDFCGDWNYTGPLYIDLLVKTRGQLLPGPDGDWSFIWEGTRHARKEDGATPMEAIARAAHAMGEGEE